MYCGPLPLDVIASVEAAVSNHVKLCNASLEPHADDDHMLMPDEQYLRVEHRLDLLYTDWNALNFT